MDFFKLGVVIIKIRFCLVELLGELFNSRINGRCTLAAQQFVVFSLQGFDLTRLPLDIVIKLIELVFQLVGTQVGINYNSSVCHRISLLTTSPRDHPLRASFLPQCR